jgi:uncharacterized protein (DUF427 family)
MSTRRIPPKAGQESVWDYPRPPRLEATPKHLKITFNGQLIAETHRAYRILETSHPPTYYLPMQDIKMQFLQQSTKPSTLCEFKGRASYWTLKVGNREAQNCAWSYPSPVKAYEALKDHLCFYASQMDSCTVDGEVVQSQAGDFYGGWITSDVVGPFKGEPGTWGW